ncbi:MAG: hypothetical protein J0M24_02985 [Verrucomicrobia bacterium]|nr:hypothetical protein [Verrucomicrobiota bacterium]
MKNYQNPTWWNSESESSWERIKAAFQRDWDQTKHDLGAQKPDTDQGVGNTVRQAAGKEPIPPRGQRAFADAETAVRFGHGARRHYGKKYPTWSPELEAQLRSDWRTSAPDSAWDEEAPYIRRGWDVK